MTSPRLLLLALLLLSISSSSCAPSDAAATSTTSTTEQPSADEVGLVTQGLITAGSEWARAGSELFHIYDPSVGETGPWYFNDHTFFYDPVNHLWHLFGIIAAEPTIPYLWDVDDAKQFGHATSPTLSAPNWTKQPNVLVAVNTALYHETHLWAPHVVLNPADNKYYMFYAGGGPDEKAQEISVAISTDLYTWTRLTTGPLFKDGFQARDPMVLRVGNEWVMYYEATLTPGSDSNYVVAYRKSTDLKTWGPRKIAFTDPMKGTDAGPTESPFVVKRGDWYYLFLGPRPYDFYLPPEYPGTDVYASKDPLNFKLSQLVGHLPVHAAEFIQDGADLWVSDAGWALGGVYLRRLYFSTAPVSGSSLYSLSGNTVKRYSGAGTAWNSINTTSTKLVTGGFGTFAIQQGTGDILRYDAATGTWPKVGGPRTGFAVNATGLYGFDSGGVYKWQGGASTSWDLISTSLAGSLGGAASAIYAGGVELYATKSNGGDFYHYEGGTKWTKIGGPGTQYAANVNGVYGLNGFGVFQWVGQGTKWVQVGGPADKIYAGGNGLYATVPFFGDVNYYNNSPMTWSKASNAASSFAVCDDVLYALRSNGVYKNAIGTSTWTLIGPVVSAIACGK